MLLALVPCVLPAAAAAAPMEPADAGADTTVGLPSSACIAAGPGAYALPSGELVVLTASSRPAGLRWIHEDGRTGLLQSDGAGGPRATRGWTGQADATRVDLADCDGNGIGFEGATARRVPLRTLDLSFEVEGTRLAGRLVLPAPPGDAATLPLVVEVQGSGRGSHVDASHLQYLLPARGAAVFVYDKRGTGRSGGAYTQDFHVLARDAAAAFQHASSHLGSRAQRGFLGSSQGGWVAPLAALQVSADFVIVSHGLAYGALQEDREQVLLGLRAAGWTDAATLGKAAEVADAAGRVVAGRTAADLARMEALRVAYRDETWWNDLGGEFTGFVARTPAAELARMAPSMDVGTSWEYEPMPTLRALAARQLWLVAGRDAEAPPEETLRRLRTLQAEGQPLTIVTFPEADHGLRQFEVVDGKRQDTRFAPGAHRVIGEWLQGRALQQQPGEVFRVEPPRGEPRRWTPAALGTPDYEASPAFTPDGRELFFMRADPAFGHFRLWHAQCAQGRWSRPRAPAFAAPEGMHDADPHVTADGQRLYFVSTRHRFHVVGNADFDIHEVSRGADGGWSSPRRLPAPVNSEASELLPRTDRLGHLYFGSARAGGAGGSDIYRATRAADGRWTVVNLREVNTPANEYEAEVSPDGHNLAVVSDRQGRSHIDLYRHQGGAWHPAGRVHAREDVFQVGPRFSPDGRRLLFAQEDGVDSGELFLADLAADADPAWPPACG